MSKLCVITGAGASSGVAGATTASSSLINNDWAPPLTRDLFQSRPNSFDPILRSYPQVNPLVHRIRSATRRGESLEELLSKIYNSGNRHEKRQLKYLTYFLRHLFTGISGNYIKGGPSHYDGLVDQILRRNIEVLFLTLNYDLILEKALESFDSVHFDEVQGYIPKGRQWKLVKLHGSVNWGRKLLKQPTHLTNHLSRHIEPIIDELDLDSGLDKQITIVAGDALPNPGGSLAYPVMMIPIEDKYEFVCPVEHVHKAEEFLKTCPNFLVVGCSMKDQDICDLLGKNVSKVSKLLVNGSSDQDCQDTQSRIRAIRVFSQSAGFYTGGFDRLMISGHLETFLDEVSP